MNRKSSMSLCRTVFSRRNANKFCKLYCFAQTGGLNLHASIRITSQKPRLSRQTPSGQLYFLHPEVHFPMKPSALRNSPFSAPDKKPCPSLLPRRHTHPSVRLMPSVPLLEQATCQNPAESKKIYKSKYFRNNAISGALLI
jgi:hypothetical protein